MIWGAAFPRSWGTSEMSRVASQHLASRSVGQFAISFTLDNSGLSGLMHPQRIGFQCILCAARRSHNVSTDVASPSLAIFAVLIKKSGFCAYSRGVAVSALRRSGCCATALQWSDPAALPAATCRCRCWRLRRRRITGPTSMRRTARGHKSGHPMTRRGVSAPGRLGSRQTHRLHSSGIRTAANPLLHGSHVEGASDTALGDVHGCAGSVHAVCTHHRPLWRQSIMHHAFCLGERPGSASTRSAGPPSCRQTNAPWCRSVVPGRNSYLTVEVLHSLCAFQNDGWPQHFTAEVQRAGAGA